MAIRTTLNISVPPKLSEFIEERVASGRYSSASEVIRAGLRLLEEHDADALARQVPGQRLEVAGVDAAPGSVTEQQGGDGAARAVGDQATLAMRRTDSLVGRRGRHRGPPQEPASSGTSSSGSGSISSGPLLRTLLTALETG